MNGQAGLTLMEALFVLAVMGLLAALALPVYEGHLLRNRRMEARLELMEVAAEQERYHARTGAYAADAWPLQTPTVSGRRRLTRNEHYEIEVQACPGQNLSHCFVAIARARGKQARDECRELSLDSKGARGAGGREAGYCW